MANSLISDLLKTPSEIRSEEILNLQKQGAVNAQNILMSKLGSPIGGAIQGLTANALQNMPASFSQIGRSGMMGLGSLAGLVNPEAGQAIKEAALSPQERRAKALNQLVAKSGGNAVGLRKTAAELIRSGNAGEAAGLLELANLMDGKVSTAEQNIAYFAEKVIGCDPSDPKCLQDAMKMAIEYKRGDTAANQMTVKSYEKLNEEYKSAETSRQNIMVANDSLRMLESGKVNVGSFAKTRQGAEKFYSQLLNSVGINVKSEAEAVARTETLMANTKRLAGQLLASGMFGSGTGISERDLQTAMEMAGAGENLTPQGMKQILELNAKIERAKLQQYNQRLGRYSSAFWNRTPEGSREAYVVDVPDIYEMKALQGEAPKMKEVTLNDKVYTVPAGAEIGQDTKGNLLYRLNDKVYNMDGTEVTNGAD
jgi:hypothetical protein